VIDRHRVRGRIVSIGKDGVDILRDLDAVSASRSDCAHGPVRSVIGSAPVDGDGGRIAGLVGVEEEYR
jgi:hypothetical protein